MLYDVLLLYVAVSTIPAIVIGKWMRDFGWGGLAFIASMVLLEFATPIFYRYGWIIRD